MSNRKWAIRNSYTNSSSFHQNYENKSRGIYDHDYSPYENHNLTNLPDYNDNEKRHDSILNFKHTESQDYDSLPTSIYYRSSNNAFEAELNADSDEKTTTDQSYDYEDTYIEHLSKNILMTELSRALAQLPVNMREIVQDRIADKSFSEIAQRREMTKRKVKKEYEMALTFLRDILQKLEF